MVNRIDPAPAVGETRNGGSMPTYAHPLISPPPPTPWNGRGGGGVGALKLELYDGFKSVNVTIRLTALHSPNTIHFLHKPTSSFIMIPTSVVDPYPYWIRIQELSRSGSLFRKRIRIHTCKI